MDKETVTKVCYDLIAEIGKRSVELDKKYGREIATDCMAVCVEVIAEYEKEHTNDNV